MSIHVAAADALDGAPPDPTSVYRYYDRHGLLIYVGITKQGMGRNIQHAQRAEWWQYVVRQEVEHYATRLAAARREKQLIHDQRPPFNKQHNASHHELRATYLRLIDTPLPEESAPQQFNRLRSRIPLDVIRRGETELLLRTQLEHEPLARLLVMDEKTPVHVWGTGMRCAWVDQIATIGSFTYLSCSPNKALPASLGEVRAALKLKTKPWAAMIMRLHVVDAGRPVVE